MAQGGLLGNGVKVAFSAASPITWTAVPQLRAAEFPRDQSDRVEITTHSVTNKRKRYMAGLTETTDPTFTVLSDFDPSTAPAYETLRAAQANGTSLWWRFEVPTNRARTLFRGVEFQASIKDFSPDTPIDGAQTTQFVLTFDGEDIGWDLTAGASEIS